jgi:hypothetical protein
MAAAAKHKFGKEEQPKVGLQEVLEEHCEIVGMVG